MKTQEERKQWRETQKRRIWFPFYGHGQVHMVRTTHPTAGSPSGDVTNKYYVVDGVEALQKFGQDAWYVRQVRKSRLKLTTRDRVVCVLTTGQEWQFRPYKWQNPKILFRNGQLS